MLAWHPFCAGGILALLGSTLVWVARPYPFLRLPRGRRLEVPRALPCFRLGLFGGGQRPPPSGFPRFPKSWFACRRYAVAPGNSRSDSKRDDQRHRSLWAASESRVEDTPGNRSLQVLCYATRNNLNMTL